MGQAARASRAETNAALTLRLTREDRDLLEQLVSSRAAELSHEGYQTTVVGYLRGLIRREAAAHGIHPRDGEG